MFLTEKLHRIADDFSVLPDNQERLSAVVDRAKRLPPLPAAERIGGPSRARLRIGGVAGRGTTQRTLHFRSDAESPLVRGLVAFVCDCFSGAPAAEIAACEADPLELIGVAPDLSPTRRNGLNAVRETIRAFARQSS